MSKPKFTPGPWEVWGGHREVFARPAKENAPDKYIANADSAYEDGDMAKQKAEANARLIATAPTMYAYLKELSDSGDCRAKQLMEQIDV